MANLSLNDQMFLAEAGYEASKSELLQRHGCIAVKGGKIVGRGHNYYRNSSRDKMVKSNCACHAEIAALRNELHNLCPGYYGDYNFIKHSKGIF